MSVSKNIDLPEFELMAQSFYEAMLPYLVQPVLVTKVNADTLVEEKKLKFKTATSVYLFFSKIYKTRGQKNDTIRTLEEMEIGDRMNFSNHSVYRTKKYYNVMKRP